MFNEDSFKTKQEVNDYFLNKYGKSKIPEEVLKYWRFNDRKCSEHQWQLFVKYDANFEEAKDVIMKYDFPQSIKLMPSHDHWHVSWKTPILRNGVNGKNWQTDYNRAAGPARIQIKDMTRYLAHTGVGNGFKFRVRWYINGKSLTEEEVEYMTLDYKLDKMGL